MSIGVSAFTVILVVIVAAYFRHFIAFIKFRQILPAVQSCGRARPAGELPLGFRGKIKFQAGLSTQNSEERFLVDFIVIRPTSAFILSADLIV